jgi:phospholipid/cholesterol/gamma-HCH transport system permease protein
MNSPNSASHPPAGLSFSRPRADTLCAHFSGTWKLGLERPAFEEFEKVLTPDTRQLVFDTRELNDWDSVLVTFVLRAAEKCLQMQVRVDHGGLPVGARRLIALATAVPKKTDAQQIVGKRSFLFIVGENARAFFRAARDMLTFIGEISVAFVQFLRGRAQFRRSDLGLFIVECGAEALPIVSLISLLVGLILAFVGAVQLAVFGAQIYVADLVGIAMVRVLGAVMAGIIMAGRTGSSFAAQLGTMQVNEEIDALQTLGISPIEFLVLPRMLALMIMMPLLGVYADLMGVLGGVIVGVGMLDINIVEYLNQTQNAVRMQDFWIGLFTAAVFGVLVSLAGCLRGMQCGRDSAAVGEATTSAVVTGIVAIIVATSLITIACNMVGLN